MLKSITSIASILENSRLNLTNEKTLQANIQELLTAHHIEFEREVRLDEHNIIDFIIEFNIGMEVKIHGTPKNIYRQLARYADSSKIKAIILATNKSMGLPKMINNKPTYIINLSRGWL